MDGVSFKDVSIILTRAGFEFSNCSDAEDEFVPAKIASFKINYFQFLSPDGRLIGDEVPPLAHDFEKLEDLFSKMILASTFDRKAIALQRTGKIGTYPPSLGHEAAHVAIGSAMREEDCFFPSYRELGTQLCRGVRMREMFLYWGGDERGNNFSVAKHDFSWNVPIATQCLHGAGAAMAFKLRKEPRVAVVTIGDGGSSKGDFLESINAASAFNLPLVLVIVNNQWAISMPRSRQTGAKTLAQKGIAGGLPSIQVDGNDLIAAHWVMEEAISNARAGKGATVVEMMTYRLGDHSTADDAGRYRSAEEVETARKQEPLARLRTYLTEQGHWNEAKEEELVKACEQQIEQEISIYLAMEHQGVESMFDHLFANMPVNLERQRQQALMLSRKDSTDG